MQNSTIKKEEQIKDQTQKNQKNQLKDKKNNRLKIIDSKERKHVCGCGKKYLSYPALFLHVQKKHNNEKPIGTQSNYVNGKRCKGRPKNEDKEQMGYNNINDSEISEDDDDGPLDELRYFLTNIGKYLKKVQNNLNFIQFEEQDVDFLKNAIKKFPSDTFLYQSQLYQKIFDNLKKFEQMTKEEFNKFIQQEEQIKDGIKTTKLNQIFAIFLYEISICITPECFKEIAYLVCAYRETLNKFGWSQLGENKKIILPQEQCLKEFCEEQTGEIVCDVINAFMTDTFPQFATKYPIDDFQIIGLDEERKINTNYIIKHFCKWCFRKKYTKEKVSIFPKEN